MADDTTGFRFLVEQIQMRETKDVPVRDSRGRGGERTGKTEGTREPSRARSSKPRQGASELPSAADRRDRYEPTFLSRRWL